MDEFSGSSNSDGISPPRLFFENLQYCTAKVVLSYAYFKSQYSVLCHLFHWETIAELLPIFKTIF